MCEPLGGGGLRLCGNWGCTIQVGAISAATGINHALQAMAGDQPVDLGGGWRYESLPRAKTGAPIGLLVTERPVTATPWRPVRSEPYPWDPADYRAASGNPLPEGWHRAACLDCGGGVLVNRADRCVDCAARK